MITRHKKILWSNSIWLLWQLVCSDPQVESLKVRGGGGGWQPRLIEIEISWRVETRFYIETNLIILLRSRVDLNLPMSPYGSKEILCLTSKAYFDAKNFCMFELADSLRKFANKPNDMAKIKFQFTDCFFCRLSHTYIFRVYTYPLYLSPN